MINSRSSDAARPAVLAALSSIVARWSLGIVLALTTLAPGVVTLTAPGLQSAGLLPLATVQLQLMAPVALFAGSLGLTGAALQARGSFLLPSLSPAITSLTIIVSLAVATASKTNPAWTAGQLSILLATAYTAGALLQAAVQRAAVGAAHWRPRVRPPSSPLAAFHRVVGPALVASILAQMTVQLDLWVASFLPGACAALGFANLLFMALTGVLSSAIIGALSTRLSVAATKDPEHFSRAIRSALEVVILTALPLTALLLPSSLEITTLLFQRGTFAAADSALVAQLLGLYLVSSTPYLLREVSARIFYASKAERDVRLPVALGWVGLALRLPLDWLFALRLEWGAAGLVVATALINIGACSSLSTNRDGFEHKSYLENLSSACVSSPSSISASKRVPPSPGTLPPAVETFLEKQSLDHRRFLLPRRSRVLGSRAVGTCLVCSASDPPRAMRHRPGALVAPRACSVARSGVRPRGVAGAGRGGLCRSRVGGRATYGS